MLQLSLINSKMFYLIKKIIRHKMKIIQSKKHKVGTHEHLTKYICHVLMIKVTC